MNLKSQISLFTINTFLQFYNVYDAVYVKIIKSNKGIDFIKNVKPKDLGEGYDYNKYIHYVPCRSWQIKTLMKILKITENDSILDIGCGKGKALFEFSKYKFKDIGGVELTEELAAIAKENMKILDLPNVEIFCDNALNFKNYNHFFFYDPFNPSVFKTVINNILENCKNKPLWI